MQSRKRKLHTFPTNGVDLEILDREHSDIHRRYLELDDAILYARGSARILEAARTLIQSILMHFAHEEQFQQRIEFPVREDQRNIWKKNLSELLQIDASLKLEEVYAALRLRGFCKGWLHQHMYVERLEFEIAPLTEIAEPARAQA